jgi:hypothetical protein
MKKLLLIGALTAALFSCKKEAVFSPDLGAGKAKNAFNNLSTPVEQKDRTVLVVLISTLTKQNARTEAEAREAVFGDTGYSVRTFFNETSGGRLFIAGKNNRLQGDVTSITVLDPLLLNPCTETTWKTLSLPALTLQGVLTAQYNTIIYITPPTTGCPSSGVGTIGVPGGVNNGFSVVYWDSNITKPLRGQTLAHEIGHNIGLTHAASRACADASGNPVALSDPSLGNFSVSEQGDPNDVMGTEAREEGVYGHLFGASRLKSLGWLTDSEITTASGFGTFTIAPVYGDYSSPRAVVVPAFIPGYDLWIETRQQYGIHDQFDLTKTYASGSVAETAIGTLMFRLAKIIPTNRVFTELIDMHPGTTGSSGKIDAGLKVGEVFNYGGKNFKLLSVAPNGEATLKIFGGPPSTLFTFGSVWKYLDNGSDQGTAWVASSFNDSGWASGPGKLGYGNAADKTKLSYGPDLNNKYITSYFRKTINIDDPSAYISIAGNVLRDDGIAIYVNGIEVYRNNLVAGATYTTKALGDASDGGNTAQPFSINPAVFVSGDNVIAVEIHQASAVSADIDFDLDLRGVLP